MLNCDRVMRACSSGTDQTAAAAAAAADGAGGAVALAVHDAHAGRPQQQRGRLPANQAKYSSTSSRTRSGRTVNKMDLAAERYS